MARITARAAQAKEKAKRKRPPGGRATLLRMDANQNINFNQQAKELPRRRSTKGETAQPKASGLRRAAINNKKITDYFQKTSRGTENLATKEQAKGVDDEVEIVQMLPPIPLRDHEVYDIV